MQSHSLPYTQTQTQQYITRSYFQMENVFPTFQFKKKEKFLYRTPDEKLSIISRHIGASFYQF